MRIKNNQLGKSSITLKKCKKIAREDKITTKTTHAVYNGAGTHHEYDAPDQLG